MSDNNDLSLSFTMNDGNPEAAKAPVDETLYAFEECEEFGLPNGAALLVSKSRPYQGVVSRDVAIALNHCRDFRSLQGHAEFLTGYMPELGGDVDGVRTVLESVRDSGLLVPAQHYADVLRHCEPAAAPARSRVFVITCDRPDAVSRLLESLLAGANLSRHESLFLVDDSRDEANIARNRELVEDFNTRSPRNIRHFALTERQEFIDSLIASLPQKENALRFLLDREQWRGEKTYGISRSLCLLLSVGYRAVVLDDDVICSAIESPHRRPGLRFMDGMCEADFYPSSEAWLKQARPCEEDPLSGHLQCLGLGLGQALEQLDVSAPAADTLARSQAQVLQKVAPGSRVLITQNGTLGDPGTGDTAWCFNLTGPSMNRLLAGPAAIQDKVKTRQYWMGWSSPTFTPRANMSQVTGLDNTAMLPPYFPAWRGEDQLFGAMVEYLFPNSLVLNYPWAVPHLPMEERSGDITPHPESAGGSGLVEAHVSEHAPDSKDLPLDMRLASLVQLLREMSHHSDEQLATAFRVGLAADQASSARQVADKLRQAPQSHGEWQDILQDRGSRFFQALGRNEVPVQVSGVPQDMDEAAMWGRFRELAENFADVLEAWPQIREAAAALNY